jgi:hypothetical protein
MSSLAQPITGIIDERPAPPRPSGETRTVADIVKALLPHPKGLRRWSVMRAIRADLRNASRDIPHKLEDDVERAFRQYCAAGTGKTATGAPSGHALFFRPAETAGEVWAVFADRATAWLEANAR